MYKNYFLLIFLIFLVALAVRFLYFPSNIYFGFDQARDAFASLEIANGQFKILGPPTSSEGLFHGALYYYIYAPLYSLGGGDPAVAAAFLRVFNALGILLAFGIGITLFNKKAGLVAALLFAFSFEQSQFAIYLNHPAFGVISAIVMYFGLAVLIFKKRSWGWIVSFFGLGLSMQFEFILTYLVLTFLLILAIFRKDIKKPNIKTAIFSCLAFLLSVLTYILAEIKFNFRSLAALQQLAVGSEKSALDIVSTYLFEVDRMVKYNLTGNMEVDRLGMGILLAAFIFCVKKFPNLRKQFIFLSIWFFSALTIYIISGGAKDLNKTVPLYYPNMAVTVSLLIFTSFIIDKTYSFKKILGLVIVGIVIFNNLSLATSINSYGSMPEINVQSGMLLSDEKKVLDYIYQDSQGEPFAVKAITMPYLVNTTWSYLFEWYGKKTYGYLPVWGGEAASGYSGNLEVQRAQDKLPDRRYLIIEPSRGIPAHLINNFLQEESYFSKVVEEKKIGEFTVQKRVRF